MPKDLEAEVPFRCSASLRHATGRIWKLLSGKAGDGYIHLIGPYYWEKRSKRNG